MKILIEVDNLDQLKNEIPDDVVLKIHEKASEFLANSLLDQIKMDSSSDMYRLLQGRGFSYFFTNETKRLAEDKFNSLMDNIIREEFEKIRPILLEESLKIVKNIVNNTFQKEVSREMRRSLHVLVENSINKTKGIKKPL